MIAPTIPTSAQFFIKSWPALQNLVLEITRSPLSDLSDSDTHFSLLAENQIQEALQGPYHYLIKSHFKAATKISLARFFLTIEQDDAFKNNLDLALFPKQILQDITIEMLNDQQAKLEALLSKHYASWQEQMQLWSDTLTATAQAQGITPSEISMDSHSISELWKRFSALPEAPIPDLEKAVGLYKYWYLQIYLSLAAKHPADSDKTEPSIKKQMKRLRKDLNRLLTQEQALASAQWTEIQTILGKLLDI